ncbi:MAG TPA: DUF5658 family protein [Phycisphaerae bacterium]|nr:DUF5658 family protein [Phycisphaerae bacterium]
MSTAQGITGKQQTRSPQAPRRWWDLSDASLPTLRDRRTRRVLLMIVLIWIVGAFDLIFTLMAMDLGGFEEANPVARQFIHSPPLLATFKFGTLAVASGILLAFAHRRITEVACWALGFVYVGLAIVWLVYYGCEPTG